MSEPSLEDLNALWAHHHAEWRDPLQITSQWQEASSTDPRLLRYTVSGAWWDILAQAGITLLVTREYEHLVMALRADGGKSPMSFQRLPHPSGLVVDRARSVVHVASTRNPNQVYDFMPVDTMLPRVDRHDPAPAGEPLVPIRSRFFPGCLYLHDLALLGDHLYGNSVGQNAIVRLHDDGRHERVWWPRSIETETGPVFGQNHLQLNSIAAGDDLTGSFFSASTATISARRPGHQNFPVDKRGVIFSGATREPMAWGLTRPHSARLYGDRVWVDNSGYGEFGYVEDGALRVVARLPGWTRGLCFHDQIAFVGTSRVIPRFRQYAPGLDVAQSQCGVHAVDIRSGEVLGSLRWPSGNQIFAIDWIAREAASGFAFPVGAKRATEREKSLFYGFLVKGMSGESTDGADLNTANPEV